jgi:hypothetical protein
VGKSCNTKKSEIENRSAEGLGLGMASDISELE